VSAKPKKNKKPGARIVLSRLTPGTTHSRFFLDDEVLREHRRGKVHKRRMKQLAEVPLDLQLQEMLHPVDNGPKLRGPDGKATAAADKDKAMA
jgi:hypothetical protein